MKKTINKIQVDVKNYLKTNVLFLTFVITSLLNSTLLRFLTIKNFNNIKPIIADVAFILIIGAFGYLLKGKKQFKYFLACSIILTAICVINSMYYTQYLSFTSVSFLMTSFQIVDVADAVVENVIEYKDFIYIWQIIMMMFIHIQLLKKNYYAVVEKLEIRKVRIIHTLVAGLICVGLFTSTLTKLDLGRLTKQWNREYIVMNFGIYTYHVNDAFSNLKPKISSMFGYDKNAKEFRDYYESVEKKVEQNKYTDIFKGKNVIAIHAESIQNFTLDTNINGVDVAPNLKRLASEGLYFSNFYSQDSVGTSSDTEFTLSTSLLPATNGTVAINYYDREYNTIQKLLKSKDYYIFSMHGNKGDFWNRAKFHTSFGYDQFFYYKKDYNIDEVIGLGLSDKSFFTQSVPKIKTIMESNKNFYGTLIMLSNHTPFSAFEDSNNLNLTYQYEEFNQETNENEIKTHSYLEGKTLGNYFKSVNYADQAIGEFIDKLDEEGILENTVIVIYGDHDSKIKKSEFNYYYNYDFTTGKLKDKEDPTYVNVDFYNYELNRNVPLIIWTKDKKYQENVTKVMGMYDVLPTLGNMLGINNEYALGNDIFSIEENIVVFPDGNWLTDKLYYNQQKGEWKLLKDETVSMEYIDKWNKHADDVIGISNSIIVYDLIKRTRETSELVNPVTINQ